MPRLLVAQAASAAPLYHAYRNGWQFVPQKAQPTQASAIRIGNPVNVHKAMALLQRLDGAVDIATEEELTQAWVQADRHGLYCDPHTGVALAVLARQRAAGLIKASELSLIHISTFLQQCEEPRPEWHRLKLRSRAGTSLRSSASR